MNPEDFFCIGDIAMSTRLTAGSKGYIVGSILKSNNKVSMSDFPMVHATRQAAVNEATRLLQTGAIDSTKKAIVLKVENYVEINPTPVVVS